MREKFHAQCQLLLKIQNTEYPNFFRYLCNQLYGDVEGAGGFFAYHIILKADCKTIIIVVYYMVILAAYRTNTTYLMQVPSFFIFCIMQPDRF